ncbi:MAG: LCP family protein [Acidimicrobiales bacterium]
MSEHDEPPVPERGTDPIVWDPVLRRFVPESERAPASPDGAPLATPGLPAAPPARGIAGANGTDPRRYKIPSAAVGRELAPQPGTPPATPGARPAPPRQVLVPAPGAPSKSNPGARRQAPLRARPLPLPRPAAPPAAAGAGSTAGRADTATVKRNGKQRRLLPHRPKLRRLVLLLPILIPLLIIVLLAAGLWYANAKFNELHRVPVAAALDGGGSGTNILLVGSDSRDLQGIPADAAGIFGAGAPTGERSDTLMVLRLDGSGAHTLSIPRDLIVTVAESAKRDRVNAAYNTDLGGGPLRLIETVKQNLHIPINRYMEVDFATFSGVVDSVGGIDIDFPHPAFDDNSGLNVTEAGTAHLGGEQALAYVRSRHYTEVLDNGTKREDPTADLGRVKRQQEFLTAVFAKIGGSRNPITLLRVGGEVVKGLRVDDALGFIDAVRLGWDLKGLHPESVELPVAPNKDNATLHLAPNVEDALARFR